MKVIINADDFGISMGVSRGIIKGIKEGVITDTSAIVNADFFEEGAKLAIKNGINSMGIHCLLTMGKPVSPLSTVPTLINSTGCFYKRKEIVKMKFDMQEVKRELEAQIDKFLSTGLVLNHIDTHHGFMHISTEMFDVFIKLAKKYNVPLRNELSYQKENAYQIYTENQIKSVEQSYINRASLGQPYHTTKGVIRFLEDAITKYKTVEIGCHVGYSDGYLRLISVLNDDREKELEVFIGDELQAYIIQHKIKLVSYCDFK